MAGWLSPRWTSVPVVTQITRCPSLATSCLLFVDSELQNACQGQPSTAPPFLPAHLSHLGHTRVWGPEFQLLGAIRVRLGFREEQSLQLRGRWGCKRHAKEGTALHQHCSIHAFLSWVTHRCGDMSPRTRLYLGYTDTVWARVLRDTNPIAPGTLGL